MTVKRALQSLLIAELLILVLLLAYGCASSNPGREDSNALDWWYDTGPNGEHCLFAGGGVGQYTHYVTMSCDAVNDPESSR